MHVLVYVVILYFVNLKKHRDTEKAEGMFGTLVIQLPSNYSGGKLIVYHQGKKSEFDYSGPGCCSNYYFTSFYADCQHEVKKVTKGYRLCLIYNLMYQGLDECPTPADNQAQVSTIVSGMKQWQKDVDSNDCPETMTYLLEHKYCEASLSFRLLKNGDRAVAHVLAQAKAEVDFDFYVGHIKFTEHWAADHDFGYYEETECCDESVSAKHLKSSDGERTISEIDIYKSSLVPEDFFDAFDPDEKEYKEATGNEGATVDKQYKWSALLLWPIKKRTAVIGAGNMIEFFKQDVDTGKRDLVDVAREIMRKLHYTSVQSGLQFLDALQVIGNAKLIAEVLDVIADINGSCSYGSFIEDASFCSSIASIGHKYGHHILRSPFQTMFAKCSSHNVEKHCIFLKEMVASKKLGDVKELYTNLLSSIVKFLADEQDATPRNSRSSSPMSSMWRYVGFDPPKAYRSKEFVSQLFSLLSAVGTNDLYLTLVSALCSKPVRYPVQETLGPVVIDVCKSTKVDKDGPLQMLLAYCISQLETALQKVVPAPINNAKTVEFMCFCDDCDELVDFLRHPTKVKHRFKVGKSRRQHIHEQLEYSGVDATDTTERVGNQDTLVVTKTNASYEKDVKKHQDKQVLLVSLKALLPATDVEVPIDNEPPAKKQKDTAKVVAGSSSHIDLT